MLPKSHFFCRSNWRRENYSCQASYSINGEGLAEVELPLSGAGITGSIFATSEDVHLYSDPLSAFTNRPLLYADCEGLNSGDREPIAAIVRKARGNGAAADSTSNVTGRPGRNSVEREVLWARYGQEQSRQYTVDQLYPRILVPFSDAVVFVHRNARGGILPY